MRTYNSLFKPQKKCTHGISRHEHCLDCLDYEISSHQTSIKLLRMTRKIIVKIGLGKK